MKVKVKKLVLLIIALAMVLSLVGCTGNTADDRFVLVEKCEFSQIHAWYYIIADKETGVMYLYVCGHQSGITVLLDAEGKPLIYDVEN